VSVVDVLAADKANPVISMYAAGIAVMFLLFGASSGGGSLLEEQENHTLERLLTTRITMDQLLLGKWSYQTMLGVVQVAVMFVWGWLVFGIDLWRHFDGFPIDDPGYLRGCSELWLVPRYALSDARTAQWISVILILTMSALGGSMVPR
jgi:ABC-2 type transport system permease protein